MNLPPAVTPLNLACLAAVAACPLLLLSAALVPAVAADRAGRGFARMASRVTFAAFGLALISLVGRFVAGPFHAAVAGVGPVRVDVHFDTLSALMLVLVSFLGAVVVRYSVNYLAGDPHQGRFVRGLCLTIGSVLLLTVSGNLLMFTLAWMATSLGLHRLLTFYPDRPAAMLAARKKFLISRLGDGCLVGALLLTWRCFGTWNFDELFAAADAIRVSGAAQPECLGWTAVLLVVGALLKSAQFPFHSWLPDTMETPTPVSALMHAGIINAGGFLVVRLSPLVAASPAALNALALVGAFTALFASVVMLTQTSVKRSLAYSTIAQMGFMMLQCGLGAFSLSVLHIIAHSLYKAHAFLSSGSIIGLARAAWVPAGRPASHPLVLAGTLGAAVAITWGIGSLFGYGIGSGVEVLLLGAVFLMALASLLWNLWAASVRLALVGWGVLLGAGAAAAYFALHAAAESLLATSVAPYAPVRSSLEYGVLTLIGLLFMAMMVLQAQLPDWSGTRLGRAFYVHASQGFYLGALANRLIPLIAGKSGAQTNTAR